MSEIYAGICFYILQRQNVFHRKKHIRLTFLLFPSLLVAERGVSGDEL